MKTAAISTQLRATQIDRVWAAGYDGRGVGIAVLDSGPIQHPDLAHRVRDYHDSTGLADGSEPPAEHAVAVAVMAAGVPLRLLDTPLERWSLEQMLAERSRTKAPNP